jgi:glucose/mannose-6-phosphate isomerase
VDGIDFYFDVIAQKPEQLRAGYKIGFEGREPHENTKGLLFTGMGGSGATAHLIRDACTRALQIPFTIVQHYKMPNHVRDGWHTLALSYSGDTEETLSVTEESLDRGVPVTAFTSGGALAVMADEVVIQPAGYQPRMAIGHAWFSALGYLEGSKILKDKVPVEEAARAAARITETCGPHVPEKDNEAKKLAKILVDKIPQIYATPAFQGSANYFRCMINENAKKIAGVELIPECNHNDLNGWAEDERRADFACLTLSHGNQNPGIQKRIDFMKEWYEEHGILWHHHEFPPVNTFQDHVVAQVEAIQFADYVSVYMAQLRGVDPTDIKAIIALKEKLRS